MISVLVLSHNRLPCLRDGISYLLTHSESWDELIVVDNGSTDGSLGFLQGVGRTQQRMLVVDAGRNCGVAAGRNLGFRLASGDVVVCLDDDAWLPAAALAEVAEVFSREQEIGVLAPRVVHKASRLDQTPAATCALAVANYHGAAHAWRKSALEAIGLLDDGCFFGGEELDSCMRARSYGFACVLWPTIIAMHDSVPRPGGEGLFRFSEWTKNYARILFKNLPRDLASQFANRLLLARGVRAALRFGLPGLAKAIGADRVGRAMGIREHRCISRPAVAFYSDSYLRPEYGNVPLRRKLLESRV